VRRSLILLLTVGTLIAVSGSAGGAATFAPNGERCLLRPDWRGTLKTHGQRVLMIHLRSLEVCGSSWQALAAIRNVSDRNIRVTPLFSVQPRRPEAGARTGYEYRPRALADSYRPALPRRLAPHGSWVGWFGGDGLLPGPQVNVGFALFANSALCPECVGFGTGSRWFARAE
jgi:hypothetical protein